MKLLGLIGAGNMGGAILSGALEHECIQAGQVMVSDHNAQALAGYAAKYPDLTVTQDNRLVAQQCPMILLAVKPQFLREVLSEIREEMRGKAVISIVAGWTRAMLEDELRGTGAHILRVMPNTPLLVGEGMTALCAEHSFTAQDFNFVKALFDAVGRTVVLPERLFDGVIAVSGSSPAYLYMMLEAMADGAVREGIPRQTAYEMAAQSVMGAAKMLLKTGEHPGTLKDAVCSPAGTTIEAVAALEKNGFRNAVMEAMSVCAEKSRQMAK